MHITILYLKLPIFEVHDHKIFLTPFFPLFCVAVLFPYVGCHPWYNIHKWTGWSRRRCLSIGRGRSTIAFNVMPFITFCDDIFSFRIHHCITLKMLYNVYSLYINTSEDAIIFSHARNVACFACWRIYLKWQFVRLPAVIFSFKKNAKSAQTQKNLKSSLQCGETDEMPNKKFASPVENSVSIRYVQKPV